MCHEESVSLTCSYVSHLDQAPVTQGTLASGQKSHVMVLHSLPSMAYTSNM